jgi:hypothetical protein
MTAGQSAKSSDDPATVIQLVACFSPQTRTETMDRGCQIFGPFNDALRTIFLAARDAKTLSFFVFYFVFYLPGCGCSPARLRADSKCPHPAAESKALPSSASRGAG